MEINNQNLSAFRVDFMKSMAALESKYGMQIKLGAITYEGDRFYAKLTAVNGTTKEDVERNSFNADVWKFSHLGLKEGDYKRVFIGTDGNRYAIIGFNTKAPKYPIIIQSIRSGEKRRANEGFIKELCDEYFAQELT